MPLLVTKQLNSVTRLFFYKYSALIIFAIGFIHRIFTGILSDIDPDIWYLFGLKSCIRVGHHNQYQALCGYPVQHLYWISGDRISGQLHIRSNLADTRDETHHNEISHFSGQDSNAFIVPSLHGFQIRWLLILLCALKIRVLKNSDEKIRNLDEGDL